MNRKLLKKIEEHHEDDKRDELLKLNMCRNTCIRGDKKYDYETSTEFYLLEPHDNDLYVQN